MDKPELITLFDYNYWANHCILDAAQQAGAEIFTAPAEVSFGSLRGTLVHVFGTEWMWRMRCQDGISPAQMISEQDFPTLESLHERLSEEEKAMRAFLAWLDDADLHRKVRYANTKGQMYENPIWEILMHIVNHGTQFRSEAGVLLTKAGYSPGDVDLIAYLRQGKNPRQIEREKGMKAPPGANPNG